MLGYVHMVYMRMWLVSDGRGCRRWGGGAIGGVGGARDGVRKEWYRRDGY